MSPYLVVSSADGVIAFLKQTFAAVELDRIAIPNGPVVHAEVKIGDSVVMIGEAMGGPTKPGHVHCYVADVDAAYARALAAGATSLREPTDMFYGDRISMVQDAYGNAWAISTHKEDVPHDEMMRRMASQHRG